MLKKKAGIVFVILGAVLILSALFLFYLNQKENEEAGEEARMALQAVQEAIEARNEAEEMNAADSKEDTELQQEEADTVEIDGYDYVGYLAIPCLGLELPVMEDWSYSKLKIAPCRQAGSVKSDDLVIAGHNYERHFGKLKLLAQGEALTFTDINGQIFEYIVGEVTTLEPTAVDEVLNSEWDLVLYTCTYGGASRVAVGCERISKDE